MMANGDQEVDAGSVRISELPALSTVLSNAMFVFERGNASYKISYESLKNYIFNNLSAILDLGSIAYEDREKYAKFAHGHDYTDFWFFSSYGPNSKNDEYKDPAKCQTYGRFDIVKYLPSIDRKYETSISVCAPAFQTRHVDETLSYEAKMVGEIQPLAIYTTFEHYLVNYRKYQLIYVNGISNIDIYGNGFDGYVIPNGTTYNCGANDFKDACAKYAGNPYATSFKVPTLTSFIKGNAGAQVNNAMQWNPYHNAMVNHNHTVAGSSIVTNYDALNMNLQNFYQYSADNSGEYCTMFVHGGTGPKANKEVHLDLKHIKIEASLVNVNCANAGEESESYPSHCRIPILMYIGKK